MSPWKWKGQRLEKQPTNEQWWTNSQSGCCRVQPLLSPLPTKQTSHFSPSPTRSLNRNTVDLEQIVLLVTQCLTCHDPVAKFSVLGCKTSPCEQHRRLCQVNLCCFALLPQCSWKKWNKICVTETLSCDCSCWFGRLSFAWDADFHLRTTCRALHSVKNKYCRVKWISARGQTREGKHIYSIFPSGHAVIIGFPTEPI